MALIELAKKIKDRLPSNRDVDTFTLSLLLEKQVRVDHPQLNDKTNVRFTSDVGDVAVATYSGLSDKQLCDAVPNDENTILIPIAGWKAKVIRVISDLTNVDRFENKGYAHKPRLPSPPRINTYRFKGYFHQDNLGSTVVYCAYSAENDTLHIRQLEYSNHSHMNLRD